MQNTVTQEATRDLINAVKAEDAAAVSEALAAGADLHARTQDSYFYGVTVVHLAARYNAFPTVIERLLEAGADVNAKTSHGLTPLHFAAAEARGLEIIKALIASAADVNAASSSGCSVLHAAAFRNRDAEVLRLLLEAGANPRAKDDDGRTPLDLAARSGVSRENRWVLSQALLVSESKTQFVARCPVTAAETALFEAVRVGDSEEIGRLLKGGTNVHATDSLGRTPLHLVVSMTGMLPALSVLLGAGANPRAIDRDGQTAYVKALPEYRDRLWEVMMEMPL